MDGSQIKAKICEKAKALGANVVRSCSVDRWREIPIQAPEFWPQNIWSWSKNVIASPFRCSHR